MALISQYTKCALCDELLGDGEIVATTHFIGDRNDPLWRFSDASMHYDCFQHWPHRMEFVSKYNDTMGKHIAGNGTRHLMYPDGLIESIPAGR